MTDLSNKLCNQDLQEIQSQKKEAIRSLNAFLPIISSGFCHRERKSIFCCFASTLSYIFT